MLRKKIEKPKLQNKYIDVDELILRGGAAPKTEAALEVPKEEIRFTFRMPPEIVIQIDKQREGGFVSRNTWILQAVVEKLAKD